MKEKHQQKWAEKDISFYFPKRIYYKQKNSHGIPEWHYFSLQIRTTLLVSSVPKTGSNIFLA